MTFLVKKKCRQLTHLFFATDIRVSGRTYRKLFQSNTIVMGGDIWDKRLILTIKEAMVITAPPCRASASAAS